MKTKVKARWVVEVPSGAKVLVSKGQEVRQGELLSKFSQVRVERVNCRSMLLRLGRGEIDELNKMGGTRITKGETFFKGKGFGGVKLVAPVDGKFLSVDEFGNLLIEVETGEKRELRSPVAGRVFEVEGGEVGLEFEAREFKGEGVGSGRVWASGEFKLLNKLSDLDWHYEGRVIFCDQISLAMVNKAEVVGVKALVAKGGRDDDFDKMDVTFPIMLLSADDMEALGQAMVKEGECQLLLDVAEDRLLVV